MEFKVKCIDWKYATRNHIKLKYEKEYTVIAFGKRKKQDSKFVILKEFPGIDYLSRRFEIISKEIVINLPDDFDNLPII